MKEKKPHYQKKSYQSIGFDLKLKIIQEVSNGQISANYAAKKTMSDAMLFTIGLKNIVL